MVVGIPNALPEPKRGVVAVLIVTGVDVACVVTDAPNRGVVGVGNNTVAGVFCELEQKTDYRSNSSSKNYQAASSQ